MPVHLLKWCVGVDRIEELADWQAGRIVERDGRREVHGFTRRMPRRAAEVTAGGSLYWIIRGVIQVRQRVLDLTEAVDGDGRTFCRIHFDPELVPTAPAAHQPIQGWRYLDPVKAPTDAAAGDDVLPGPLAAELRGLGLL